MNKYHVCQIGVDYTKEISADFFEVKDGAIIFYTESKIVAVFPVGRFIVIQNDSAGTTS